MASTTELRDSRVYYGVCTTAAETKIKEVSIYNPTFVEKDGQKYLDLEIGDKLIVSFTQGNTASGPALLLSIKDTAQNITISSDTQSGEVITGDGDSINWRTDVIVSFVFVYRGIYGDDSSGETVTTYVKKWKVDNRTKVATNDYNGLVRIATSIDKVDSLAKNYTALSAPLVQNLISTAISNMGITSTLDTSTGKRTIKLETNNTQKQVVLPKMPTMTSELSNTGNTNKENEHYFSNITNSGYLTEGLGLGYSYKGKDGKLHFMRSFAPYVEGNGITFCSIGYGNLRLFQEGVRNASGKLVSNNPHTYISGQTVRLFFDKTGSLTIGERNIPKNMLDNYYTFNNKIATFEKPLKVNDRIYCKGITFIDSGNTITDFVNKKIDNALFRDPATAESIIYPAGSNVPDNKTYSFDKDYPNHLRLRVTKDNCRAIALAGYNIDQYSKEYSPSKILVYECYLRREGNHDYVYFGLRNLDTKKQRIKFTVHVLYKRV